MVPQGKILIIGGAEDKGGDEAPEVKDSNSTYEEFEILKSLVPEGHDHKGIEVITSASDVPDEIQHMYKKVFRKIGYNNVGFIDIDNRMEAREKEYCERINEASTVLFSGGNQFRISTLLGGTPIADLIRERYMNDKNFIVAGTSAGAMAIARIMIVEGGTKEVLLDTNIKTSSGLGLLEYCIVDTHFIKRGRFGRLAHAVVINPGQLGVGLGEDAALLVRNGSDAECYGSGMVVIIDGKPIGQTNITETKDGDPAFIENLRVHLLVKGCRFSLKKRRLELPAIKPQRKKAMTKE
jgi:cyanophycinase